MLEVYMGNISACLVLPAMTYELRQLLDRYKRNHTVFDYMNRKKIVDQQGNVRMGPPPIKAVYYIEYDGRVYLPITAMYRLLATLQGSGYDITMYDATLPLPDKVKFKYKKEIKLYPIQKLAKRKLKLYPDSAKLLGLGPGQGKNLDNDTPVPTPTGFVRHGDLAVGDEVIGSSGEPIKVIAVYPQPKQYLYRVTFEDNTYLDAGLEHLWTVLDDGIHAVRTVTTETLLKEGLSNDDGGYRYIIPTVKKNPIGYNTEIDYKYINQIHLTDNHVTIPDNIFSSTDIIRYILLSNLLTSRVKYLKAGYIHVARTEEERDDILKLFRSLMIICTYKQLQNGNYGIYELPNTEQGKHIVSIHKLSYQSESSCIRVDASDNLYLAGDHYTLTHNTFTALDIAIERSYRFMVFAKSGDINQWKEEIEESIEADIIRISGTDKLIKVLEDAKLGKKLYDIVLVSLETYRSYVKRWLQNDDIITVMPYDLVEVLQLGTCILDETHKELSAMWSLVSLTNVDWLIGLSGTMSTDEARDRLAQNDMFPQTSRFTQTNIKPYIKLVTYVYGLENPNMVVTSVRGRTTYSHMAFEKWIMSSPYRLNKYVDMLCDLLEDYYLKRRKPGDRCMIFVYLVKLADRVIQRINLRFSDKYQFTLINYTGVLKKDTLQGKDIIVTTIIKSGTALDIKGLVSLINSVQISKVETAKQNIQRLREPKYVTLDSYLKGYMDDTQRIAVQLQCADINTHAVYGRNRARLISKLLSEQETILSDVRL